MAPPILSPLYTAAASPSATVDVTHFNTDPAVGVAVDLVSETDGEMREPLQVSKQLPVTSSYSRIRFANVSSSNNAAKASATESPPASSADVITISDEEGEEELAMEDVQSGPDVSDSDDESASDKPPAPHHCTTQCESPCFIDLRVEMSAGHIPTVYPTMQQFTDFNRLVHHIHATYEDAGLAKVVPPADWQGYNTDYTDLHSTVLQKPVQQNVLGSRGVYRLLPVIQPKTKQKGEWTIGSFAKAAEQQLTPDVKHILHDTDGGLQHDEHGHAKPTQEQYAELERRFWKSCAFAPPLYGADTPGQLFDPELKEWNVAALGDMLQALPYHIPGGTLPFLYVGMWKSMFPVHVEDMNLFSINYIHTGMPKQWYSIPVSQATKFEKFAATHFFEDSKRCPEFLRHKHCLFSPSVLREASIQVNSTTHEAGTFMLTFPKAYHWGFNLGFNVAESLNFALPSWIPYGRQASYCKCKDDSIHIDVEWYIQDVYNWLKEQSADVQQWHRQKLTEVNAMEEEWIFYCRCRDSDGVSSLSSHRWPTGDMFRCACCSCLTHWECYERYADRQPTHRDCEPVTMSNQSVASDVMDCMLDAVTSNSKRGCAEQYQQFSQIQQNKQQSMYCYRCLPTNMFRRVKLLHEGTHVTTVERRFTQWRLRQIAFLRKRSAGKLVSEEDIAAEDAYNLSEDEEEELQDIAPVHLPPLKLSEFARNMKVVIDRDLPNPNMPKPNTLRHLAYLKNLFVRINRRRADSKRQRQFPQQLAIPGRSYQAPMPVPTASASQQQAKPLHTQPHLAPAQPASATHAPAARYYLQPPTQSFQLGPAPTYNSFPQLPQLPSLPAHPVQHQHKSAHQTSIQQPTHTAPPQTYQYSQHVSGSPPAPAATHILPFAPPAKRVKVFTSPCTKRFPSNGYMSLNQMQRTKPLSPPTRTAVPIVIN